MHVLKFGGTSVGTPERMHKVAQLICLDKIPKVVVLSAVSGITNMLVGINELLLTNKTIVDELNNLKDQYHQFINKLYNKNSSKKSAQSIVEQSIGTIKKHINTTIITLDEKEILAQGEIVSTQLFQLYLKEIELDAILLNALDFIFIDEQGEPDIVKIKNALNPIIASYPSTKIFIAQGFICSNTNNQIDNLKRGGSDYTASLIGAAVNAEEIQIWTDIDGMHNNDPRYIKNTFPIQELNFDEAAELAYFGAKILHPASILPAKKFNIPVRLKSTLNEKASGTLITQRLVDKGIKAIAAKDGIIAVKIKSARMLLAHGFLRKVWKSVV